VEDRTSERQFERVKTAIDHIRSIRAEYRISPKSRLKAAIVPRGRDVPGAFEGERETIVRLAALESLTIDGAPSGAGAHAVFGDGSEVFVALEGVIDVSHECRRLSTELERLDRQLQSLAARLANESFVSRAPADVVATERAKEQTWLEQRSALAAKLKALGC
jgi:valyl-tRNA synthetase